MIVFGNKERLILSQLVEGNCQTCKDDSLVLAVYQNMFDVFWIPTIPLKKRACIICVSCQTTYPVDLASIPEVTAKTPLWSFSGLAAAAVIIVAAIFYQDSVDKEILAFKENPQENVYLTMKIDAKDMKDTPYSYAKVVEVKDGKMFLSFGVYAYSRNRGAEKAVDSSKQNPEKYLNSELEALTMDELKSLNIQSLIK